MRTAPDPWKYDAPSSGVLAESGDFVVDFFEKADVHDAVLRGYALRDMQMLIDHHVENPGVVGYVVASAFGQPVLVIPIAGAADIATIRANLYTVYRLIYRCGSRDVAEKGDRKGGVSETPTAANVEKKVIFYNNPDGLEIGTPGKGGCVKVSFDIDDPDASRNRVEQAMVLREHANRVGIAVGTMSDTTLAAEVKRRLIENDGKETPENGE